MASTLELLILAQIAEPPWTALSLINSWSNTGGSETAAQWRYLPLSNEVEAIGTISHSAIAGGSSQFAATFTSNLPASNQRTVAWAIAGAATLPSACQLLYVPAGTMSFFNIPNGTTEVAFHAWFSLDA